MKKFEIPEFYKSPLINHIKSTRKADDRLKTDFTPTKLDFGPVVFYLARHFGFCYGVENAIEIVYKVLSEHEGKRIFLLSEMIHNPSVNQDLMENGIQFLMDTTGKQLIPWEDLTAEDVLVIPAFGTTVEILAKIEAIGMKTHTYDTTCPFVEKVWKRSYKLGVDDYTVVIHGKASHEETRATFSHSSQSAPSVIVQNLNEAKELAKYIRKEKNKTSFYEEFKGKFSAGFDPDLHLQKIGVVNQTTMLATETQEIADYLKKEITAVFDSESFADTRDTLCYATSDNQKAVYGMLDQEADLAIVVGGYNSSNTSHLVELCEEKLKTYHISSAKEIQNSGAIRHFKFRTKEFFEEEKFIPQKEKVTILVTGGASSPDSVVEDVIDKIVSLFEFAKSKEELM